MESRDLLVIGGGPGGIVSALRAAKEGLDVTLAERDKMGGTCLNRGCIPSKALAHVADVVHNSQNNSEIGIEADVSLDYSKSVSWSNENIGSLVLGVKRKLKNSGIEVINSEAFFESSNRANIEGQEIEFERSIIATGSSPNVPPGIEVDHERVIDSNDFFEMTSLPESILILGAGYIGMELGTICRKLGSEVKIIEALDKILPSFDESITGPIDERGREIGLDIHLNREVGNIEKDGEFLKVHTRDETFSAKKCLVASGRFSQTEGLGLENTGVEFTEDHFIDVDDRFRTSDQNIYAVGDVVGGKMLAHEAYNEAVVAVDSILGKDTSKSGIPEVVFTDPQLARVGSFEKGHNTGKVSFKSVGAAYTKNQTEGMIEVSVDDERIIKGGRIVGPFASEIIHEIGIAVENELSAEQIVRTVHAHPTISEAVALAVEDAMDYSTFLI